PATSPSGLRRDKSVAGRPLPEPAPPLRAGASAISPSRRSSATRAVVVLRGRPMARDSSERLTGPESRIIDTRCARSRVCAVGGVAVGEFEGRLDGVAVGELEGRLDGVAVG